MRVDDFVTSLAKDCCSRYDLSRVIRADAITFQDGCAVPHVLNESQPGPLASFDTDHPHLAGPRKYDKKVSEDLGPSVGSQNSPALDRGLDARQGKIQAMERARGQNKQEKESSPTSKNHRWKDGPQRDLISPRAVRVHNVILDDIPSLFRSTRALAWLCVGITPEPLLWDRYPSF